VLEVAFGRVFTDEEYMASIVVAEAVELDDVGVWVLEHTLAFLLSVPMDIKIQVRQFLLVALQFVLIIRLLGHVLLDS